MNRLHVIGLLLFVIAATAAPLFAPIDPVLRLAGIGAVSSVSLLAGMVFLLFAFKDKD